MLKGVWFVQSLIQAFLFFHIQILYVMIAHTLNMCTLYFVHIW